jgi:hypothetical protein
VDKDTFKPEVLSAMMDWADAQRNDGETVRIIR